MAGPSQHQSVSDPRFEVGIVGLERLILVDEDSLVGSHDGLSRMDLSRMQSLESHEEAVISRQ